MLIIPIFKNSSLMQDIPNYVCDNTLHMLVWTIQAVLQLAFHNCQGDCGSSYAFSAIGSLEGVSSLARGNLISLSEQNIIDCSGTIVYSYIYLIVLVVWFFAVVCYSKL